MKIIVGSTALEYFNLNRKEPSDLDVWCDILDDSTGDIKVLPKHILELVETVDGYATPDSIYTIKCSHLGWSNPMWSKHKLDILWLKNNGCSLNKKLFDNLVSFWKVELGDKSFLSLSKDKSEFFTDHVEYKYDHDYLHELVSYPNRPVYTKVIKDNEQVLIDKSKFDNLTLEEKVRMFREEITVIACERWLFNSSIKKKISWIQAYHKALQKTITNLTKGWATEFIVLNLEYFYKPDYSYFEYIIGMIEEKENG